MSISLQGLGTRSTSYRLTTMSFQSCGVCVSNQICFLFSWLDSGPETYDEVAPKIEYWIELALTKQFITVDKLVEDISALAWDTSCCPASFVRFLREFLDSPRRSTQARSFVGELCTRIFLWFAAASADDLYMDRYESSVTIGGGYGFVEAALFVGHLIQRGLLDHDLVRLHLVKPLTAHYYFLPDTPAETVRANAICALFDVAGCTLVQGPLEPEDVRVCFEIMGAQSSRPGGIKELSAARLEVRCFGPDTLIGAC